MYTLDTYTLISDCLCIEMSKTEFMTNSKNSGIFLTDDYILRQSNESK